MKYLRLDSLDPYLNLAIEEYMLDYEQDSIMMLWQNQPCVVVGKNQNIRAEVDTAALSSLGILPVRRITGGGAVYHDGGNINYTFISHKGGEGIDFASFSAPIIDALASLGITISLSGRNDLCLPDGRKVSGNAQCVRGNRILHHGTLLFDADLGILGKILTPDEEKLKSKAVRSTSSRVANLSELLPNIKSARELMDIIEDYIIKTMHAEVADVPSCEKIKVLRERNSSSEWLYPIRGIGAEYTIMKKKRYPFGSVEVLMSVVGERIENIKIGGDFFGTADISELEKLLSGKAISELCGVLDDDAVGTSISGMSAGELISLLEN